jgi:hypothetical protein
VGNDVCVVRAVRCDAVGDEACVANVLRNLTDLRDPHSPNRKEHGTDVIVFAVGDRMRWA